MSIGEVQARIGEIQSIMISAATGVRAAGGAAAAGATSAVQFAAALDEAVSAQGLTTATGAGAGLLSGLTGGLAGPGATTGTAGRNVAGVAAPGGYVKPTTGTVSSTYGPRWGTQHEGLDVAAASGTPIRAVAGGVVEKASWYGGYGNAVIIDHGNGVKSLYAHASALNVKEGDRVQPGQVVAKVGSTGDSTGPHLHFEVEVNGKKIDPQPWLRQRGISF